MRTTLDIPDELYRNAKKASGAKTKTMVVILGLKELVHSSKMQELRKLRGKIPLEVNISSSRKRV